MIDLFPVIKNKVIEMINNKENEININEFIDGQVVVYSISKEEAKILKEML